MKRVRRSQPTLSRALPHVHRLTTGKKFPKDQVFTSTIHIRKETGAEKRAMKKAANFAAAMGFLPERIEDVKTAVGEATANAIEHGTPVESSKTVLVQIKGSDGWMEVEVSSAGALFVLTDKKPDIQARIEGLQKPRGWGLYLIGKLADQVELTTEANNAILKMRFFAIQKSTE